MRRADMEEHGERNNKVRVSEERINNDKEFSPDLCFQAGQDDLTPLTWLHSNVNIFPTVDTPSSPSFPSFPSSSYSFSSCTTVTLNNNEDLQEKVLKVEMNPTPLSPESPAENTRQCAPLDQTAAASEEDGFLDLSENFKTEESKQLFLRNAIKICWKIC